MSGEDNDPQTSQWHLDKRIPVALIAAIALQFSASVYWIATLEQRSLNNAMRIEKLETQMDPVRLVLQRIDQRLENIERTLRKQEDRP